MDLLIIGHSRIVQNKVLPAAMASALIDRIDLATRRPSEAPGYSSGALYDDYGRAIRDSEAPLVYISSINSQHESLAIDALNADKHVIVDKPMTTSLTRTSRLAELAAKRGLGLAEATVYPFHPVQAAIQKIFEETGTEPRHIVAAFSFPPLDDANFRYRREAGGGALLDLGAYACSPGRLYFSSLPEKAHAVITDRGGEDQVDTSFSLLMEYPHGRTMMGHFGFNTEYQNRLTLLGPGIAIEVDRVFSPPPTQPVVLKVAHKNERSEVEVPPADCFKGFLDQVIDDIEKGCVDLWRERLLMDAEAIQMAGESMGSENPCL